MIAIGEDKILLKDLLEKLKDLDPEKEVGFVPEVDAAPEGTTVTGMMSLRIHEGQFVIGCRILIMNRDIVCECLGEILKDLKEIATKREKEAKIANSN